MSPRWKPGLQAREESGLRREPGRSGHTVRGLAVRHHGRHGAPGRLWFVRTAYRCRAYPAPDQVAVLNRTFGCVRLVWNKTLADRNRRYRAEGARTSYRETDAALTGWKRTGEFAFLSEVSSVPLQQTLRHQHTAFRNFFAGRARYPRFKSRTGRQSAHYTRSAFRMRDGVLTLAKTSTPLRFVWSFDDVEVTALDPTMVVVS